MKTSKDKIAPAAEFSDEALFDLELQISRRADELAKAAASNGERDLEHWLQAEFDIMARHPQARLLLHPRATVAARIDV
jgi:hypothetical protein